MSLHAGLLRDRYACIGMLLLRRRISMHQSDSVFDDKCVTGVKVYTIITSLSKRLKEPKISIISAKIQLVRLQISDVLSSSHSGLDVFLTVTINTACVPLSEGALSCSNKHVEAWDSRMQYGPHSILTRDNISDLTSHIREH